MDNIYAVIENQVVVNMVVSDAEYAAQNGWVHVNGENVAIGWGYVNNEWIAPQVPEQPPTTPNSVTMRQARLALLNIGKLNDVDAALSSISDEYERLSSQIEWEYATVVERNAPLVLSLTTTLGMTETQMDELFRSAALL